MPSDERHTYKLNEVFRSLEYCLEYVEFNGPPITVPATVISRGERTEDGVNMALSVSITKRGCVRWFVGPVDGSKLLTGARHSRVYIRLRGGKHDHRERTAHTFAGTLDVTASPDSRGVPA